MRYILLTFLALSIVACNQKEPKQVTNPEDYTMFLAQGPAKTTSKFFELWNGKIKKDSIQLLSFGNVASEYHRFFTSTGDIAFLESAEKALAKAVDIAHVNKSTYKRALARTYISQHQFQKALVQGREAARSGGENEAIQNLLFDVHMELGNYDEAKKLLGRMGNTGDFESLIRIAKWNDYKGDLDTTIRFMEKALAKAMATKNTALMEWSYANIGDYYGHAGRIKESYESYLKTLALNPDNAYAKKGIAWIVFSHENNAEEALRILDAIMDTYVSPDYYLLKAEIAAFIGDEILQKESFESFYSMVNDDRYGPMYNTHLATYFLEVVRDTDRALEIAQKEVALRPTPESYGLLAKVMLKMGKHLEALEIVEQRVVGKTHEPAQLLTVAQVYRSNKKTERVAVLKSELQDAVYELGPLSKATINAL